MKLRKSSVILINLWLFSIDVSSQKFNADWTMRQSTQYTEVISNNVGFFTEMCCVLQVWIWVLWSWVWVQVLYRTYKYWLPFHTNHLP